MYLTTLFYKLGGLKILNLQFRLTKESCLTINLKLQLWLAMSSIDPNNHMSNIQREGYML